jgi:hypothetical protein
MERLETIRNWYKDGITSEVHAAKYKGKTWLETVDVWIRPTIMLINNLPGCATVVSCAGKGPRATGNWHRAMEEMIVCGITYRVPRQSHIAVYCENQEIETLLITAAKKAKLKIALKWKIELQSYVLWVEGCYGQLKKFGKVLEKRCLLGSVG